MTVHALRHRHQAPPRPAPDPAAVLAASRARGAIERTRVLDRRSEQLAAETARINSSNGFVSLILEAFAR